MAIVATTLFADRVAEAVLRKRTQLVVGLDPRPELLPVELGGEAHLGRLAAAEACGRFCRGLVDAVAPYVVGVKPQVAFFEALGADGVAVLEDVCAYATAYLEPAAQPPVRDSGRVEGGWGNPEVPPATSDSYPLADALTVNPYLGRDSIDPYLGACRRHGAGIFCVVKTSNQGGSDVQDLVLSDGRSLWQQVAELVREWGEDLVGEHGLSAVGAVIGATHPRAVGEARRLLPQSILLLPGVGAQGATPADVARAFTSGPASALVNVARDVIYAFRVSGMDWRSAAAAEASRYAREVFAVSGW